jgi:hypothetical protein
LGSHSCVRRARIGKRYEDLILTAVGQGA